MMDTHIKNFTVTTVLLLFCMLQVTMSKEEEKLLSCGGQQVCATLMQYKDGTVTDEGDYCECKEGVCSKEWDEAEGSTLTWQHYERTHWSVQYKVCRPLFQDKPECVGEEMGAQVDTAVDNWAPHVTHPRCVCPGRASYRNEGWKRVKDVWQYYYSCLKINCSAPSDDEPSTCANIFVDPGKSVDRVIEMEFLCSCPEGFLCPAKFNEKEDNSKVKKDDQGRHFVAKQCEAILKRKGSS